MRVLFLCTGNSCRSQMAEGWSRALHDGRIAAFSAGIAPHGLDPRAVRVMAEAGVDISEQRSQHVSEILELHEIEPLDWVVTVCDHARESCPVFPGQAKVIHRGFPDPPALAEGLGEEDALEQYRKVRDQIRSFVQDLPSVLATPENP